MRDKIKQELLQSNCSTVVQTSLDSDAAADHYHYRRNIEPVECDPCDQASAVHNYQRKSEKMRAIAHIALEREMHPAENQRKCDRGRKDTAPHYEEVHYPALTRTFEDKTLFDEVGRDAAGRALCALTEFLPCKKELESALEIDPRCGPLQPYGIAKGDRSECDDTRDRIAEKSRIEIFQVAGTDYDECGKNHGCDQADDRRVLITKLLRSCSCLHFALPPAIRRNDLETKWCGPYARK